MVLANLLFISLVVSASHAMVEADITQDWTNPAVDQILFVAEGIKDHKQAHNLFQQDLFRGALVDGDP